MMSMVRKLRKPLGLPVDVLAHKAGVSTRHLVLWEKYGLPPRTREVVEQIARALGVDPEELLEDSEEVSP